MNSRMKLLFLLLTIVWWTKQSESGDCALNTSHYSNEDGTQMVEFCFQCLGDPFNTSLTTIVQDSSCIPQTVTVEHITPITIHHTQIVYNPTTVEVCPTPSPSTSMSSPLLTSKSSYFVTLNTAYTTWYPACTPSTVTATIYQQSPIIISSDILQISILASSGVLICLPISALVLVTCCWVRTCRKLKKKRNGMNIDHSAQNSILTTSGVNNPAYETQIPFQKNLAYEDTTLITSKPKTPQVSTDTPELAYEIVPLVSVQPAAVTTHEDTQQQGRRRINRDIHVVQ